MRRPLMKRLPHELRARPTPMHPGLFSATGQDRGNSAITLQLAGAAVAVALCSECSDQTWHQGGSRSRQRIKDYEISMLARGGFDLLIVGLNCPTQFSQKRNQCSDRSDAGFYYSLVVMTLSANSLNRFVLEAGSGTAARRAITCPNGHKTFSLEYGPLDKPRKGANKNGIFAKCIECGAPSRLTSGHIK
jgi:hypothetical protein